LATADGAEGVGEVGPGVERDDDAAVVHFVEPHAEQPADRRPVGFGRPHGPYPAHQFEAGQGGEVGRGHGLLLAVVLIEPPDDGQACRRARLLVGHSG
jgi:hypothetical protein